MRTTIAALALLASYVAAECPNACSGHGTCGNNDMCQCFDNWMAADCSERVCPFGLGWADSARGDLNHDGTIVSDYSGFTTPANYHFRTADQRYTNLIETPIGYYMTQWSNKIQYEYFPLLEGSVDSSSSNQLGYFEGANSENLGGAGKAMSGEAHFFAECSGRGTCDRSSGMCSCFDGFDGASCQRASCPSDCSGHGVCLNLREIAAGTPLSTRGRNYRAVGYYKTYTSYDGVDAKFEYNLWDAQKQQACVCDKGHFGPDCGQRECPRGADPHTMSKYHCGNSACTSELQAMHIKYPATGTAAGVLTRLAYIDVYGDGVTTIYSEPFLMLPDKPAQTYAEQVQLSLHTFPNNILAGTNVTVSAFYDGTNGLAAAYPENQRLNSNNDVIELRVDYRNGPQGNVNALQIVNYYPTGSAPAQKILYNSWAANTAGTKTSSSTGGDNTPAYLGGSEIAPLNGNRPNTMCSGRGQCDFSNGECQCFTGYTGVNCGIQSVLAA